MIHAYNEEYLLHARNVMGKMFDFVVYDLNIELESFFDLFIESGVAYKFYKGDTGVISGKSGYELALQVLNIMNKDVEITFPNYTLNHSKEYWLGYFLSYYSWYSNINYEDIILCVYIKELLLMYDKYHEMDIMHFVDKLNEIIFNSNKLKFYRKKRKLSQKELATLSNIPIRTIQQYEQNQKDLDKANVTYLVNLARVLNCNIEDLL